MLVGRINEAPEIMEHLHLLRNVLCGRIHIQRQPGPERHAVLLPPAAFQLPQHEAAHVLDVILLCLRQFPVLLRRLLSPNGRGNALYEFFQFHLPAVPPLLHP